MAGERIVIAGGGAAGFFAAIACAQARPENEVCILERGSQFLTKVRISGGGRCNVTHAALDARAFASRYPRGEKVLLGALHRFSPEDTVEWFQRHGVRLKTEGDGRMFPVTDSSGTVIDCLMFEAQTAGVRLLARKGIEKARKIGGAFELTLSDGSTMSCDRLLLATGGARDSEWTANRGIFRSHASSHRCLRFFPFMSQRIGCASCPEFQFRRSSSPFPGTNLRERGPLLITHNGVSGPSVLRLSAWGARELARCDYKFTLRINWLPEMNAETIAAELQSRRMTQAKRQVASSPIAPLPARLWEQLVIAAGIPRATISNTLTRAHSLALVRLLTASEFPVEGKSLNKDEFVTCGGVRLSEVNFKTMESRLVPHLYFAGELLDIDGITGGFNFQSAWSTGWIAGRAMADAETLVRA